MFVIAPLPEVFRFADQSPGHALPLRAGSAALRRKTSPGKVRETANPSAALGTTKERATLPSGAVVTQKVFFITLSGRTGPMSTWDDTGGPRFHQNVMLLEKACFF
jgi:hypothetical protein